MSLLGRNYRFQANNTTGQAIDGTGTGQMTIHARRYKFDNNGALSFEASESGILTLTTSLADADTTNSFHEDNSSNKWLGGEFKFRVHQTNTSANGDVVLRLQRSTDGGTTWPSASGGHVVSVINFNGSGLKTRVFHL